MLFLIILCLFDNANLIVGRSSVRTDRSSLSRMTPTSPMTSHGDDATEVERELGDVNARYDAIERSLQDRQTDLKETLHDVKIYLQEMQELLTWLEDKDQSMPPVDPLPVDLAHAQERLEQHRRFHDELLGREESVASLKRNAQQLVRSREHASGHKDVKRTLRQLGKKIKYFHILVNKAIFLIHSS